MTRDEIETAAAETVADIGRAGYRTFVPEIGGSSVPDRDAFADGIARKFRGDPTIREFVRIIARAEFARYAEWGETGIDPDRADGPDGPDPYGPYGPPFE